MSLESLWHATTTVETYPRLVGEREIDVLIVGAGIAGLTAALLLERAGRNVAVIESRRIGAGETGNTTAHLTELLDMRYHTLESKFGRKGARVVAESSRAAINRIESFASEIGPNAGFSRVPAYLYAENRRQRADLERELESLQRYGSEVSWSDALPVPVTIDGAIRLERQGQFHPLEYLKGLAERFTSLGGQLFEETAMLTVEDGSPCRVTTSAGVLRAREVLVLTNAPVSTRVALHTKIAAYRTYAVAAQPPSRWPAGLFWDMQEPYHYYRTQETRAGTFVIVGGEDHKTGQKRDTAECFRNLEQYAQMHLGLEKIEYRWSGQIIEPADGLPFIGKNAGSEHIYVATGFSGTGMTFGTLSAMVLSDRVLGRPNPWGELYDSKRVKPIAQAREYVAENVDFPAHLVGDRLARGEVDAAEDIPRGEGRLVRSGGKMLAVYKDEVGELHARSAVCTHLGCHVRWNNSERTWDCPCHGSRFAVDGNVVNGPATKELARETVDVPAANPKP